MQLANEGQKGTKQKSWKSEVQRVGAEVAVMEVRVIDEWQSGWKGWLVEQGAVRVRRGGGWTDGRPIAGTRPRYWEAAMAIGV